MKIKSFDFITKKFISVCCAIAVLATSLPLSALLMRTDAATTGDYIDFQDKNAGDIVNGNDNFTIGGQEGEDKYYFYSKNNTADTLTLTFDDIKLKAGKKYTLDMDIYTLRTSEDADNNLLGLKIYGNEASLETNVINFDVIEEMWSNYHVEFTAKEADNKFDFSIHTIGKVVIEDLAIVDENGARTELDFATACGNTDLKDHFSAATLYEIANEDADYIQGYIKANIPENAVTYINEYIDIPLGTALTEGKYTLSLDLKFLSTSSDKITMCMAIFGEGIDSKEQEDYYKWYLDTKDVVMNKYSNYTREFNLTEKNTYIRIHAYQGTTVCIDNVILKDGAGQEVVKFDFDEAINFTVSNNSNNFVQKGIAKTKAASYALFRSLSRAAQDNYVIEVDNSQGTGYGQLYLNEVGMPYDKIYPVGTYTIKFDFYLLEMADNNDIVAYFAAADWSSAFPGNGQKWLDLENKIGEWQTLSFDITTVKDGKFPSFSIGAGIKGYLDNYQIIDKKTGDTLLDFSPVEADLGKVSKNICTVIKLEEPSNNNKVTNYVIEVDNSKGTGYGELFLNEVGMPYDKKYPVGTYTVKFDFYLLEMADNNDIVAHISATGWGGNAFPDNGQKWLDLENKIGEWQTLSFDITTVKEGQFPWFYIGAGIKGYLDNYQIIDKKTGDTLLDFSPVEADLGKISKTICKVVKIEEESKDEIEEEPKDETEYSGDYAVLVDNSKGTGYGELYLNEVGMPYDKTYPVGTYTVKFDFYPLEIGASKDIVAHISATGWGGNAFPGKDGQVWLKLEDKIGEWQTLSFDVKTIAEGQFPWFYIDAGIKGYLDNYQIIDKATGTTLLDFSPVEKDLGKVSKTINTVVDMPLNVAEDKNNIPEQTLTSGMNIAILKGKAGKDGASIKLGGAKSPLTLKDNTTYKLYFKYYQANPTDTGVLNLFGIKPDASVIGKDNGTTWYKKYNADGWTTTSLLFTTGDVTSTATDWLEIILNGNAWVYFDDFKIKEQEIDNNKEIQVVDFKNADDSIYPYSKVDDCEFSHSNEMGGTFKAVNSTKHTGKESSHYYSFNGIKMKSDTTYKISLDYYVEEALNDYAAAFGYNEKNLGIGSNEWAWVDGAFINSSNTNEKGWFKVEFTVKTGEVIPNANYINLAFYDVNDVSKPRVMHFDNLTVKEVYKIETSLNDATLGTVKKSFNVEGGKTAKAVATAFAGATFDGWYEYGELVSTDRVYLITNVSENHKLQARFSGKTKPATTIVQSFEDYDLGEIGYKWYEIVDDSNNVLDGKQSLHVKPDVVPGELDPALFFPLVANCDSQMKKGYTYDVYVWIKPVEKAKSLTYYSVRAANSRDMSDILTSGEQDDIDISQDIKPDAQTALETKDGWCKYRIGSVTKEFTTLDGFCFQVSKFSEAHSTDTSIDDLYIDRVEIVERTPDFANLKFTEKFFNEITNSNFEEAITNENWGPLTAGLTVEKVTNKEFDWQGDYQLNFNAEKSNGQPYVRVIPISKIEKNYTFAAWAKLSSGSDITVGLYKNGNYETFENVVNGEKGTLPLIDDGKWNRVSFTFNNGDSKDAYLVIKGTKGTLQLDMVELFIAERGYLEDPNVAGFKSIFEMVDPIAFPDIVNTVTTYIDADETDETQDEQNKKPQKTKKKYRVIKKRKAGGNSVWLWVGIGAGGLVLAAAVIFFILFRKNKKAKKEAK